MKISTPNPLSDQIKEIYSSLARDRNSNFNQLEYFLKLIVMNREITFLVPNKQGGLDELVVPAKKAWEIIATWSQGEGNLPVGDKDPRFNIRSRATRLLDYIQTNVSGKTAEAAGSYRLILEQAKYPAPPVSGRAKNDEESNLQKVFELRRKQIALLESRFMSPLTNNLSKSKLFANIPDAATRAMVLQMIAAGNANFRYNPKDGFQNFTAEKLHQMLLHQPNIRDVNSVMRLAYAKNAQLDFEEASSIINSTIKATYKNEGEYQQGMADLRSLSSISPSLDSVKYLVNSLNISANPQDNALLIKSIRSHIIAAASQNHIDGTSLLKSALKSAGFAEISIDHFQSLVPYVEEIQIRQRHLLLGSDLSDQDARLLSTAGLATEFGVDLTTPWIKKKDLDEITERVLTSTEKEYKEKKLGELSSEKNLALQQAFDYEYSKGDKANLHKLAEISSLMSKYRDFGLYHDSVDGHLGYKIQELLGKGLGNYRAVKQPVDRFTAKIWGGIDSIDDIVRGPQRELASWWEETQEKYPWLNPGAMIANKWIKYQTGIAIKIHDWAITISTSNAWLKSFAGHIADFTEGFVKHDASWSGAGSFFISKKIGNTLDWATKFASKGKYGTFTSLRFAVANKVWNGFTKLAPGLSSKMALDGFKKVIIGIIGGEMTMGVSIAIQIGWEVIKYGFSFLKKLLTDSKFRERVLNKLPILLAGGMTAGIAAITAIPFMFAAVGSSFLAGLGAIISMLFTTIFVPAMITVGSIILAFFLLFQVFNTTIYTDSGTSIQQAISDIVCSITKSEAPSSSSNPKLAAAKCIYELLNTAQINPLNKSNASGANFNSFATALGNQLAASEISRSATEYLTFQCVGFDVAVDIMTGGSGGFTDAKDLDTNIPGGYSFKSGVDSCSPGDFFVDKNGKWGHTGVFVEPAGANIVCLDANSDGKGIVRDESTCRWPTSKIAGCLKKN